MGRASKATQTQAEAEHEEVLGRAVADERRIFGDERARCSFVNIEEADANLLRGIQVCRPQELGELGIPEVN